jgi:hypothetical protein
VPCGSVFVADAKVDAADCCSRHPHAVDSRC